MVVKHVGTTVGLAASQHWLQHRWQQFPAKLQLDSEYFYDTAYVSCLRFLTALPSGTRTVLALPTCCGHAPVVSEPVSRPICLFSACHV